jgi:hypothetical protein
LKSLYDVQQALPIHLTLQVSSLSMPGGSVMVVTIVLGCKVKKFRLKEPCILQSASTSWTPDYVRDASLIRIDEKLSTL